MPTAIPAITSSSLESGGCFELGGWQSGREGSDLTYLQRNHFERKCSSAFSHAGGRARRSDKSSLSGAKGARACYA